MKCPKCGSEAGNGKFCLNCGTALNQTTPQQSNIPPQPQSRASYQSPVQSPKKRGGCLKVGLIVLGVIVVIGIIGALASSGENPDTLSSSSNSSEISSAPSEPEDLSSLSEEKDYFGVGETAESGGVKMTLTGITESTGSQYLHPNDGNVYLQCHFEIENNSDKDLIISSLLCFETYVDEYSTSQSISGLLASDGKNLDQLDGTVAAGKKMKGTIAYEVPANWQEIEIRVNPDVLSIFSSETIFKATHN